MKQKARHWLNLLLGALLGVLGFASCEGLTIDLRTRGEGNGDNAGKNDNRFLCMYGQPSVRWQASGKVTDSNGNTLKGIRVAVRAHKHMANTPGVIYDRNDWYYDDTLYTDADGLYKLEKRLTSFTAPDDATIVFEDIDGSANGGWFASQTATPKIKQTQKGDNSWYGGAYAVEADVKLKKK